MIPLRIAIIGAGYSGALQAVNLLRFTAAHVTLIDRAARPGLGVAYSTPHADHLLNVRAARMSAFADAPDHFADWLAKRGLGDAASFAERRVYGSYLEELLGDAAREEGARLRTIKGDAIAVTRGEDFETVRLANGEQVEADAVILSVGNLPPERPSAISPELSQDVYVTDPWAGDIVGGLADKDQVLLIGAGLTAIDAALTLDAAGFEGRIVAISRRGLAPRVHDAAHAAPGLEEALPVELSALLAAVRRRSETIGWPAAVDQLRPHTQGLWAAASVEQRHRFLRHLRPWWDVHRHRIAPEVAARIASMEARGRLRFRAGKLIAASPQGAGAELLWRPRGSDGTKALSVRRIVNCTGPQGDLTGAGEPLLTQLLEAGRIRADACRIGIDIDTRSRALDVEGKASDSLYAIGPMTRGALWEIVAVPDLRVQVERLARQLGEAA
jgi:uncharacterized NAD(P)/FAD-binding protein YdhS